MTVPDGTIKPIVNNRPLVTAALGFSFGIFLCAKLSSPWLNYAAGLFAFLLAASIPFGSDFCRLFLCALLCGLCRYRLFIATPVPLYLKLFAPLLGKLGILRDMLFRNTDALFFDLAPLFRAMLWGDASLIERADTAVFRTAGLAHILALSGLHVGFFAGAFMLLIPKNRPRLRFSVISVFLFLYCCIAAFPASLVRAGIMTVCSLGAALFRRKYDLPCSLAFSALVILTVSPDSLMDIGFQLSFSALAGIALLAPIFEHLFERLPSYLSKSISVTAAATAGTLPLSLLHFHTLPLYSLISNLFLLPLVPFSLISAFAASLLYFVSPFAAKIPAFVAYHLMWLIRGLTGTISSLPFADISFEKSPGASFIMLSYLIMFVISPYVLRSAEWKTRVLCAILLIMLTLSLCGILFI